MVNLKLLIRIFEGQVYYLIRFMKNYECSNSQFFKSSIFLLNITY
jgi:hypothetical protein